ncbi:ubiquinone/menaquinone biosynthesis methyltransferase [Mailhella sp.]|uniref:ubiquinone/menaquinone biosynthesis methyltransferase n=1 Tax=Mailhella sp. TaxID=1981029 RepID=UPI003AB3CB0B
MNTATETPATEASATEAANAVSVGESSAASASTGESDVTRPAAPPATEAPANTAPEAPATPAPEAPASADAAASAAPTDEHTRHVSEMFGRMTPWYDLQNRVFSLFLDCWWRRNLVRSVVPGPTGVAIDMAAGTLDVTLALIRRYPGLRVYATDICEPMLRYGVERKMRPGERSRVTAVVADARRMPLPDACADAVTIAFGIRNVRPRMEALREMHRLLVPGGRACILEFAPVSTPLFGPLYHWYLRRVMPRLAGLVSRSTSAYDYFAETIENFPKPDAFSDELREAGFAFVQHIPFTLGVANLHIAVRG